MGVLGVLGSFPETSGEEGIPGYFRGRGETSGDGGLVWWWAEVN